MRQASRKLRISDCVTSQRVMQFGCCSLASALDCFRALCLRSLPALWPTIPCVKDASRSLQKCDSSPVPALLRLCAADPTVVVLHLLCCLCRSTISSASHRAASPLSSNCQSIAPLVLVSFNLQTNRFESTSACPANSKHQSNWRAKSPLPRHLSSPALASLEFEAFPSCCIPS